MDKKPNGELMRKILDEIIEVSDGREKYKYQALRSFNDIGDFLKQLCDSNFLAGKSDEEVEEIATYLTLVTSGMATFAEQMGAADHES